MIIEDGTGTGRAQKVDTNNRAHVFSVSLDEEAEATKAGKSFNFNTGNITLTDALVTTVLYIKNDNDLPLVIDLIDLGFKGSTGGVATDMIEIDVVRNPTTGDIITNANAVDVNINRDFGSSLVFEGLAYKGASAETAVNGTVGIHFFESPLKRFTSNIDVVLRKGDSIALNVKPQASNTSMVIFAALVAHHEV